MMKFVFLAALVAVAWAGLPKPCDKEPCQNGGECHNGLINYYCQCARGFYGQNCENKVKRRCDYKDPCQNGGECVSRHFFRYRCNCRPGYSGKNCQHAPCDGEPCVNGACSNNDGPDGGYTCSCNDGFQGVNCDEEAPPKTYSCENNNPCTPENIAAEKFYHPHDDSSKFCQCDAWGNCFTMNCPPGLEWDEVAYTCNWP